MRPLSQVLEQRLRDAAQTARVMVEARVESKTQADLRQRADQWIQADGYFSDQKTVAVGIAAGPRTVTPSNMTGIVVGMGLDIDTALSPPSREVVVVTATTGTTFTAVFASAHANNFTIDWPFEVLADGAVRLRAR